MEILKHLYYKLLNKKYELTDEIVKINNHTLHRIRALKDFGDVKKGDLGGFVEREDNLSHKGNCWVYNEAMVYDEAVVSDYAVVEGKAWVGGEAEVKGNARICNWAKVEEEAKVYGGAKVEGEAWVCGKSRIYGNARVNSKVKIKYSKIFVPRYFSVLWYLKGEV